jgi:hypothetical protein
MAEKNLVIWAQDAVMPAGENGPPGYLPLMNSGFNTLVLASFHIHPDLSIFWNGHEIIDKAGNIPQPYGMWLRLIVDELLQNGGFSQVLLSFGGGGLIQNNNGIDPDHTVSDEDFKAFYAGVYGPPYGPSTDKYSSEVFKRIRLLYDVTGATGIDVDTEAGMFFSYGDLAGATLHLSEWAIDQRLLLTWTPYERSSFWEGLAMILRDQVQRPPLSWAHIQPPGWELLDLSSWAKALDLPIQSIIPGFQNDGGAVSPSDVQNALAEWVRGGAAIAGAYLWTFDGLIAQGYTPKQMATAMTNGLNGITSENAAR